MAHIILVAFALMFVGAWTLAGFSMVSRRPKALAALLTCGTTIVVPLFGVLFINLMPRAPEVGDDLLSAEAVSAGRWLQVSIGVLVPAAFIVSLAIFTRSRVEIGSDGSNLD